MMSGVTFHAPQSTGDKYIWNCLEERCHGTSLPLQQVVSNHQAVKAAELAVHWATILYHQLVADREWHGGNQELACTKAHPHWD